MNAHAAPSPHKLVELAKVIRSKNAGPFELTFDIMFDRPELYEYVKASHAITPELIAGLYRISHNEVLVCRAYDPALAFKITIRRPVGSGDLGESDVYGCQQHMPLTEIEIPGMPGAPAALPRGGPRPYGEEQ